jgi:hypothetical protein
MDEITIKEVSSYFEVEVALWTAAGGVGDWRLEQAAGDFSYLRQNLILYRR